MNGTNFDMSRNKSSFCSMERYINSLTPKPDSASQTQPTAPRSPSNSTRQTQTTPPPPSLPFQQGPPPVMDYQYIAGYLNNNIGSFVRAEFIVGSNQFIDKSGRLLEVGINYFVLEEFASRHRILCDLYSVKFVTFYDEFGDQTP